jgi:hypothetical protein
VPDKSRSISILPVNAILLAVGLADLFTTLFWVATGRAIEVNPIMAAVLRLGVGPFVLAKLSTLAAFVCVVEWYRRRRNPVFARVVGNITLFGYLGIYAVAFVCVNHGIMN